MTTARRLGICVGLVAAGILAAAHAPMARAEDPGASESAPAAMPRPVLRRLTRVEYSNSLHDIFGVWFPFTDELPPDGQAGGFDNNGDALSLTPVLLETYLKLARKAGNLIIGVGPSSPVTEGFPATGNQSHWIEGLPMGSRGGVRIDHYFPRSGEYELRAFTDYILPGGIRDSATNPPSNKEGVRFFKTRVKVSAGPHIFFATFPQSHALREGVVPNLDSAVGGPALGGPVDIRASAIRPTLQFWLDGKVISTFEIHGPDYGEAALEVQPGPPMLARAEVLGPINPSSKVDTAARRALMSCKAGAAENACAEEILGRIARRAYRREVTPPDMSEILKAYEVKRQSGSFEEAIGMGLCRILVSPDFIFRVEVDPSDVKANSPYRVSDTELATRLSYFLWSSIPDDELLRAGLAGQLKGDALHQQVRRMLEDPRADALVTSFAIQWLGLQDFDVVRPDNASYPQYDDDLGQDFQEETRLYVRSLLRENRSILEVISSDYSFLNERLANLYGVKGVYGDAMRKVSFGVDSHRGGILSQSAVLMVTSHPTQTSQILRGKWVLTSLLNSPPPVPPPGVPPLNTKPAADGHKLTTREQFERHRSSPVCNVCHSKMDPYGIALENYDVIGRWRTEEEGLPLDTSTALPKGKPFTGPSGLKELLLSRSDQFATATVSRMMIYALGRKLERSDEPAVEKIVAATKSGGYRFNDILLGIVDSDPFQMRQSARMETASLSEKPQ
jgi:Protein of unknown function (DUF1592)/Protein of unknown function (DUF1588)/Protein of unknown function (DUF1585)/Protein of unknown function (DUF1587)/Protein of unknown function (DUF1595)